MLFAALSPPRARVVLDLAQRARLSPLVARAARISASHPDLGGEVAAIIRDAMTRDMVTQRTIDRIHCALSSAKLGHLFLKGACFRETLYAHSWTRTMGDIDILIHPHDVPQVVRSMLGAGFKRSPLSHKTLVSDFISREVSFVSPDRGPGLDIHFNLFNDHAGFKVNPEDLFQRSQTTPSGLPTMTWEDHLLHASIHLARQSFHLPLRHVLDVHRLLSSRPVDMQAAVARARTWGCLRALYFTLEASRFAFGTEGLDRDLQACQPGGLAAHVLRALLNPGDIAPRRRGPLSRLPATMLLMDRPLSRLGFFAQKAVFRPLDMTLWLLWPRRLFPRRTDVS